MSLSLERCLTFTRASEVQEVQRILEDFEVVRHLHVDRNVVELGDNRRQRKKKSLGVVFVLTAAGEFSHKRLAFFAERSKTIPKLFGHHAVASSGSERMTTLSGPIAVCSFTKPSCKRSMEKPVISVQERVPKAASIALPFAIFSSLV